LVKFKGIFRILSAYNCMPYQYKRQFTKNLIGCWLKALGAQMPASIIFSICSRGIFSFLYCLTLLLDFASYRKLFIFYLIVPLVKGE